MIKQKTAARETENIHRENREIFDYFKFGNVILDIPSYKTNGDHIIIGLDSVKNFELRLFFRDRFCQVVPERCDFTKCKECKAVEYNPVFQEYICKDPTICPAVNSDITEHKNFAKPGNRARYYPSQLKENMDYA